MKLKRTKKAATTQKEGRFEMRLAPAEKAAFKTAAERQGIGLAQWLRLAGKMILRSNDGKVEL